MKRAKKPQKNPWKDNLYGTYEGHRGSTREWRKAFSETLSPEEAQEIIKEASPWDILFVKSDATMDEIRTAYRVLCMQYHPDKYPDEKKAWAHDMFIKIEAAYVVMQHRKV